MEEPEDKVIDLTNIIFTLIRHDLIAQVTNMGGSIFIRFPNGDLFDLVCKFVHNVNDHNKRKPH